MNYRLEQLEPRTLLSAGSVGYLLQGDLNLDGYVDGADAALMARMAVRLDPVNLLGDISGDGRVNGLDASLAVTLGAARGPMEFQGRALEYTIYDGRQVTAPDGTLNVFVADPTDMGPYWTVDASTGTTGGAAAMAVLWGPTGVPTLDAIHQGLTADCYLLAALGSLILTHPADLMNRITLDATGFAVEFNSTAGPHVIVHVDDRFSRALQVDNGGVFPLVLEKAYVWFRGWDAMGHAGTTFDSIGWGDAIVPYRQLGAAAFSVYTAGWSTKTFGDYLSAELAAGYAVSYQTAANAPTEIPSHVYVVLAVNTGAGTAEIWNPWGFRLTVTIADIMANDINFLTVGE